MTPKLARRIVFACLDLLLPPDDGKPGKPPTISPEDAAFYAAILRHYLHQDALLWSRVQLLIALQAGVLATAVAVRTNSGLAAAILALGAFLTLLLFCLVLKDERDRDVNVPLLDALARELTADRFPDLTLDTNVPVRLTDARRPWYVPLRGGQILHIAITLLLAIDMALAILFTAAPGLAAAIFGP